MLPQRFYSTEDIRRHADGKTHFFDRGAMRFFSSRIGSNAYTTINPYVHLFVTSEQFVPSTGKPDPRYYTIRAYDSRDGDVKTIGKFQEYANARVANKAAKELALEIPFPVEDQQDYANALNEAYDNAKRRAQHRGETKFYVSDLGYVSLLTNRHFFMKGIITYEHTTE